MKKNIFFFSILSLLLITSCAVDEQCREKKTVNTIIGFYHIVKSVTGDTITTSTLTIDTITIRGLKYDVTSKLNIFMDSILYNKSITNISLPLNKLNTESKFEITFKNRTKDTISVLHENSNQYLSLECGCIKVFKLDTVLTTNHFIDSIRIKNSTVNTTDAENIRLYK
jgi:hypothetical protein